MILETIIFKSYIDMCTIIWLSITLLMGIEVVSNRLLLKYTKINILVHKYPNINVLKSANLVGPAYTSIKQPTPCLVQWWLGFKKKKKGSIDRPKVVFNYSFNLYFFTFWWGWIIFIFISYLRSFVNCQ